MQKYKSYQDFYTINKAKFDVIQMSAAKLKAPRDLGKESGMLLAEAEELEHFFLNAGGAVSELMFGLSASVLDAETNMNNVDGLLFSQKSGNATEKRAAVACDQQYLQAAAMYHELKDLKDYLERKREDFEKNHYFYKQFRSQK